MQQHEHVSTAEALGGTGTAHGGEEERIVALAERLAGIYRSEGWEAEEAAKDAVIDAWVSGQRPRIPRALYRYYARTAFRGALRGSRAMRRKYGVAVPITPEMARRLAAFDPTPLQALEAREEEAERRAGAARAVQIHLARRGMRISLENVHRLAQIRDSLAQRYGRDFTPHVERRALRPYLRLAVAASR